MVSINKMLWVALYQIWNFLFKVSAVEQGDFCDSAFSRHFSMKDFGGVKSTFDGYIDCGEQLSFPTWTEIHHDGSRPTAYWRINGALTVQIYPGEILRHHVFPLINVTGAYFSIGNA